jgi:acetolactate synthase-1/2/3 large subunit
MANAATQDQPGGGRRVPVYEILAQDIRDLGTKAVFGLMSDDTAVFAVTLDAIGIPFYGTRHENTAVAMADAYSEATGGLAIAVIGRGPATANGLHAAVYANRSGSKVLIIYGEAPVPGGQLNSMGPDYKGFNAAGVLTAAGLQSFAATSPAAARPALADAAAAAMRGGAVTLRLPVNVQLADIEIPADDSGPAPLRTPRAPEQARPMAVQAAVSLLSQAKRPVIIGGHGAHLSGAGETLRTLADRVGALLVTTARGKDLFSGHPFNFGIIGSFSHSAARRMVEQADCVIAFGAGLNFFTMSFGHSIPAVPLIQVDAVRARIGQWTTADVALVGDARLVADQLLERLPERGVADMPFRSDEVRQSLASFDMADDFQPMNTARTLDPRSVAMALDKMLPTNRNMVYDAGNFLGVVPYFSTPGPGHFKMTNVFASIGLGVGAAMGFAKARPDETTVLVIGDGGLMMTLGELETVVREDLPMVIILINDCAYGAEVHFLRMHQLPIAKSLFPDIDFAPIAEALGYETATVRTLEDVAALASMLAKPDGPIFIDCKVNADVAAAFMSELAQFEGRDHD